MALSVFYLVMILCLSTIPVFAQGDLKLTVRRMFGLNLGSQVRSYLTLIASGPANLQSVAFLIDGQLMQEDTASPYEYTFHTDQYAPGWHELSAQGKTSAGSTLPSNVARNQFLSPAEGNAILFPIAGVVMILGIGKAAAHFSSVRAVRQPVPLGTPRNYGASGGTVCPRCGRPFPFHRRAINLPAGRLDICEHCGRWGIYRRRPLEELFCAEVKEGISANLDHPARGIDPAAKRRRELEASRFEDID